MNGQRSHVTPSEAAPSRSAALAGRWRGVLQSPGGELPFGLDISSEGSHLAAVISNGAERIPIERVELDGRRVTFGIDLYSAVLTAELDPSGDAMRGEWRKTIPDGSSQLPFEATRGGVRRFEPLPAGETAPSEVFASVAGDWTVSFSDSDGSWPAAGEFSQDADGRVSGTFRTETGDFRFLEGDYHAGRLRLSTFDGAHAFLFDANATDADTLQGDFWSRDRYHATFTATRGAAIGLSDPFGDVELTNPDGEFRFGFADLDGNMVSPQDDRYHGRVLLVEVFGTWCPNCKDQAPLMASWYRKYHGRGLDMIGLAFEFTGDVARDTTVLRRYGEYHGIEFPLLLAGVSDKQEAAKALPDLSRVKSYPTTVFIGRDGKVRRIYSGFSGPATGDHHTRLVAQFEAEIERLLAETPPAGG